MTSPAPEQDERAFSDAVAAQARALRAIRADVLAFRRQADGLLFGWIGLDALLTLLPGVGGLYSLGGGFYLAAKARRARCGAWTMLYGAGLILADVVIGAVVGGGDIVDLLFRSHAMFADHIIAVIDRKLAAIEAWQAQTIAAPGAPETADGAERKRLRAALNRAGRPSATTAVRLAAALLACAAVVAGVVMLAQGILG